MNEWHVVRTTSYEAFQWAILQVLLLFLSLVGTHIVLSSVLIHPKTDMLL
jgi:hypothetical protein